MKKSEEEKQKDVENSPQEKYENETQKDNTEKTTKQKMNKILWQMRKKKKEGNGMKKKWKI